MNVCMYGLLPINKNFDFFFKLYLSNSSFVKSFCDIHWLTNVHLVVHKLTKILKKINCSNQVRVSTRERGDACWETENMFCKFCMSLGNVFVGFTLVLLVFHCFLYLFDTTTQFGLPFHRTTKTTTTNRIMWTIYAVWKKKKIKKKKRNRNRNRFQS